MSGTWMSYQPVECATSASRTAPEVVQGSRVSEDLLALQDSPRDTANLCQVAHPFDPVGDVRCIETPAGEVVKTVHVGPYDQLVDAHNAIHAWCVANNRKIA